MAEARDTASPDVVSQFPDLSYSQARQYAAAGTPLLPRKQGRSEKGRFESTPERQKKYAKVMRTGKYDESVMRPSIKKAMYYNAYAACGLTPARRSTKGLRDQGQTLEDLLAFMLERMTLEDGSTFKVENASEVDFIIQQVRTMH